MLRLLALSLALSLGGCAAQMAYQEGERLVEQRQLDAGVARLREAVLKDPDNARYRIAYVTARDRAIDTYLAQGDAARAAGNADAAQQAYGHALAFDPQHEKARAGLRALEMDARHARLMTQARAAIEARDADGARRRLNEILAELPSHDGARQLLVQVNERFAAPPPPEAALSAFYRKPITIEFKDAPLRQVFDVIARQSGLNFIFDKDVKTDTRTSIYLKNSTVEAAIFYVLTANQLEQQVMDGNTILIYPNVAAKLKEYQEMVIKTFYLSNADAKLVANTLKTILKSRDVVVDEKLNLIILRDNAEAVRLAEKLIALQDVAEPEVMLEVEVLEVKRSRLTSLGINWPDSVALAPLASSSGSPITVNDLRNLNGYNIGVSGVGATINTKRTSGDSNTLANPRIRVRNHEKAKVLIGEKAPTITTTISPGTGGFASESINYVDVGLTLNVEPSIYLNNEVGIRIALEVSNVLGQITTRSGTVAYRIGTRQASTFLQLKDGENQVLAGLINNDERSDGQKLPLLGDLPIVGRLFGNTTDDNQKTEIVLSITPHLIRNVQRPEAAATEFTAGTEASFRRRPDASPRQNVVLPPMAPSTPMTPPPAGATVIPVPPQAPAQPPASGNDDRKQ
ncbi:secretin N-terminal domain-containing protein [Massilia sp. TS11]|uniref:secretin N-terminal domain-containing protein n=1 Tax=Massilia sp. TS11 TaxID=2908003 RepID=UPI001EDBD532|nr:secretin N-terminal domain-containing protein [Massilia sp. TS11]MCG2586561.1 general secretion pathway protein GspD [Massilia sp. TS11]